MRWKQTMGLLMVLLLAVLARPVARGASGTAQLGVDQRNKPCDSNFGFAYYTADSSMTDTCTTLDRSGGNTLIVTDGVASPENPEPVLLIGKSGNTATFTGRTGNCYYIVTGVYGGGGGPGGPGGTAGETAKWKSEFDSQRTEPHFVVTINDRDRSDDDAFCTTGRSLIQVELHDEANVTGGSTSFTLSQQPSQPNGTGTVKFVDSEGNEINPNQPRTVNRDVPNVDVYAEGLELGEVTIIAQQAN